jgi:hypothetical protein
VNVSGKLFFNYKRLSNSRITTKKNRVYSLSNDLQ